MSEDEKKLPETGETQGGLGGGALREEGVRDTRLIERAVREQWPIDAEYREAIVRRQVKVAIDPDVSSREATAAARCIVAMVGQNQAADFKALDKVAPDQHNHTGRVIIQLPATEESDE